MKCYLRSDVTRLSEKDIQDIISAKNSMKRASEVMTNKYKISSQQVYQIWRGVYPPIDPKEIVSYPPTDSPSDSKNMTKPTLRNSVEGTQGKGLYGEELKVFYEKGVKEDEKSKAETARLL
ncbi:14988_t:CDS:2, partial [Funneliformis caledonium]